jgi:hypothetical protein
MVMVMVMVMVMMMMMMVMMVMMMMMMVSTREHKTNRDQGVSRVMGGKRWRRWWL